MCTGRPADGRAAADAAATRGAAGVHPGRLRRGRGVRARHQRDHGATTPLGAVSADGLPERRAGGVLAGHGRTHRVTTPIRLSVPTAGRELPPVPDPRCSLVALSVSRRLPPGLLCRRQSLKTTRHLPPRPTKGRRRGSAVPRWRQRRQRIGHGPRWPLHDPSRSGYGAAPPSFSHDANPTSERSEVAVLMSSMKARRAQSQIRT